MIKLRREGGFSPVEAILILAVLGLFGFIGWRVYQANQTREPDPVVASPAIQKAEDLDKTVDDLNKQDIDAELDTSEIDSALE